MSTLNDVQCALPLNSGFAFTPVLKGKKSPTSPRWNERVNAFTRPEEIQQLTSCNVGLLHAFCTPATCSLDVDDLEKAKQALSQEAGIDIVELLSDPKLARISSGRPNRAKIIFTLPEGHQGLTTKVIRDDDESVIFELRCADSAGNSVCDVIPPSIHPSGSAYVWTNGVGLESLTEMPTKLTEYWLFLLEKDRLPRISSKAKHSLYRGEETPRRIALLEKMLEFVSADCSRDKWKRIVFSIMSSGYTVAEQIAHDWSITSDRYTDDDFWNLIRDYDSEAVGVDGAISLGTIYFYAREQGWNG